MRLSILKFVACGSAVLLALSACNLPTHLSTGTASPTPLEVSVGQATPTPVSLPVVPSPSIQALDMLDVNNGWGLSDTTVLRTADGGASWQNATPSGVTAVGMQASSFFLDARSGWLLLPGPDYSPGTLYHTIDGGATWTASSFSYGGALIQFRDPANGAALVPLGAGAGSEAVAVYTTTDSGASWARVFIDDPTAAGSSDSLPLGGQKGGMSFRDASHGWIGGSEPMEDFIYLFDTSDGGHTWAHQDLSLPAGFSGAMTTADAPRFFGASDAVLPVGLFTETPAMVFYLSHDGGASWTPTVPASPSGHYSIASRADFFVWDGGPELKVSHDSGGTWTTVSPNIRVKDSLISFQFVNATAGWALTTDAAGHYSLYRTADGGATWTALIP